MQRCENIPMFSINFNFNFPKPCHLTLTGTQKYSQKSYGTYKLEEQDKCLIFECHDALTRGTRGASSPLSFVCYYRLLTFSSLDIGNLSNQPLVKRSEIPE